MFLRLFPAARRLLTRAQRLEHAMKLPSSIILFSILLSCAACGSSGDEEKGSESGSKNPTSTGASPTDPNPSHPSSPNPSGAPASPCVSATKALCARACACGTGGGCVIAYGANAVATEEHDSLGNCETFYAVMVCGDASLSAPYATDACKAAIDGASCMDTKSKGRAIAFPQVCNPPK